MNNPATPIRATIVPSMERKVGLSPNTMNESGIINNGARDIKVDAIPKGTFEIAYIIDHIPRTGPTIVAITVNFMNL